MSAFGGVIAANGAVTEEMAAQVAEIFTEVIIAPGFEPAALKILTAKKNQRLLRCAAPAVRSRGRGRGKRGLAAGQRRPADADRGHRDGAR